MARPKDDNLIPRAKRMFDLRKSGHSLEHIAEQMKVSRATVARGVKSHKEKLQSILDSRIGKK